MAIITNNPILQNPLAKKAFSKISFEAGEKFNARIVSVDQQKGEVNLKLLDGWQFSAKLDKPLEQGTSGNVLNFEVEGFEEGKLKIKLVYEDKKNAENDILKDVPNGKMLSNDKTDVLLFEKMIKHDMPLTKENIIDIKNLIDFKGKISLNGNKEEAFITKYIESRNIDPSSPKATEITKVLKDFFAVLKNLDVDEILLFKENNIGLTKENLESFIKLFKGDSAIYSNLKEISSYLLNGEDNKKMKGSINSLEISENQDNLNIMGKSNEKVSTKELFIDSKLNNIREPKSNEVLNNKGVMVDKIQNKNTTITQNENNITHNEGNITHNENSITQNENNIINNKLSDNNSKIVLSLINKELKNLGVDHIILSTAIENLDKVDDLNQGKNLEQSKNPQQNNDFKLQNININKVEIKTLVDKILKSENIQISSESRIKLIGNLEVQLNKNGLELENKNLKHVKKSENIPLDKLDKTTNSEGKIDNKSASNTSNTKANGYGKNNSLNEIINMIKKELNFSDIDKKVLDNVAKEIAKTTTDILIKDQIKLKTNEIRDIVKDIIENKLNLKPETYEKVMDMFNQKSNDIKLFNSISQQYYYLDLPINVKEDEYQLKLIIKDDRKKGKKIDSTNVKIATSIKTVNMGTVDAYIKISNNNMNIDINCNEFFVKVLDISKEKLIKDLSSLSYRVNINVKNKIDEFTLANCGEFFNDRNFNTINVKV